MAKKAMVTKGDFTVEILDEVAPLRYAAEKIQAEIAELEVKARSVEDIFAAIREKRGRLRTINKVIGALTGERGAVRHRRPNGANEADVRAILKRSAMTVKEIAKETGIPEPSVRATLRAGDFSQGEGHRWAVS